MNKNKFTVTDTEHNERIDKVLTGMLQTHSRNQIQAKIKDGLVKVNNEQVKSNYRCQIGDNISWIIQEVEKVTIQPEKIPLQIVYEDDYLLIINKPKGMVVYPTLAHPSGTLVNALLHYTRDLSSVGGVERPGIVHRLDRDTSGIMVIAKTNDAHKILAKQFSERNVERIYGVLVHGDVPHDQGIITAPIARDPMIRTRMAVHSSGREAITHFVVKARYDDFTYLECELKTGRTHQIRVHMQYVGHSIVGEPTYITHKTLNVGGQLLFAKSLRFKHPETEEEVYYEVPVPSFINGIIDQLGAD